MKKQDIIFWKADTHVKYHIISCWEAFRLESNWVHIIPKFTPSSFLGILSCNYFGYLCAYIRRLTSCSDHTAVYSVQFGTYYGSSSVWLPVGIVCDSHTCDTNYFQKSFCSLFTY